MPTKSDLLSLNKALTELKKIGGKPRFAFFTHRLAAAIKPEIDAITEAIKEPESLKPFHEARRTLLEKFATKDESGKPKQVDLGNGLFSFEIPKEDRPAFDAEFAALTVSHKDALDEAGAKAKAAEELLKTDHEKITYTDKVKIDLFPDGVTGEQLDALSPWLE